MTSVVDTIELQPDHGELQSRDRLTPELYARTVFGYSRQAKHPLYPGKHYTALGRLLLSPYPPYRPRSTEGDNSSVQQASPNAVILYDLSVDTDEPNRAITFNTLEELDNYNEEARKTQPGGRVIFLQGYISPLWLNHIGSKFEVDPEFFLRHLDFLFSQPRPEHFPMLSLPSCAEIIRIRITSIMSWNDFQHSVHNITAHLRSRCERQMKEYLKNLGKGQKVVTSDSIVRRFSVFDSHHFALEQMMTVCVNHDNLGWTAIVWLDQGRDLHLSNHGPWKDLQQGNAGSLAVQPVIQYRRRIALRGGGEVERNVQAPNGHPIASTYGNSLRPEIMASDTFYTLVELFRLAIASESQFLTLVSHKVKQAITQGRIEDLQNALTIIEDHREHILENLALVKAGGHSRWPKPKPPEQQHPEVIANKERLHNDLEHLRVFVGHLVDRCTDGISVMMNDAMYRQSQRAIEQTEVTIKLGVLVFFFAPLSLTTSFFSMSVTEVSERRISVWVWVIASIVMLGLSFILWRWNPLTLLTNVRAKCYQIISPTSIKHHR